MNGMNYNKDKKEIIIKDGTHSVIWQNVEEHVFEEIEELFMDYKNIDDILNKNNCIRTWGYK